MMEEEKQQEIQQKYMELQMLGQQMNQIQKHLQLLENQSMELSLVEQGLEDIKNVKKGTKILAPITSGIFIKAKLEDNEELLVNTGANTTVKKDIPSTKQLIKEQSNEIKKAQEEAMAELQKMMIKSSSIENEINKLTSEK